jgi:hypothetical protein
MPRLRKASGRAIGTVPNPQTGGIERFAGIIEEIGGLIGDGCARRDGAS